MNHERILTALRSVAEGTSPEEAFESLMVETAVEDYQEGGLQDPFEDVSPDALDEAGQLRLKVNDLLSVIEIQRNALEFLMRENLEKAGEDVSEAPQRVDFLLSQPLG